MNIDQIMHLLYFFKVFDILRFKCKQSVCFAAVVYLFKVMSDLINLILTYYILIVKF